jgi:hypothetical protein
MPARLTPEDVLNRAGGLHGFPAYCLFQSLGLTRLRDLQYVAEQNDIVDEWHALYAPYSRVIALDKRTVGRVRSTRLQVAERVTAQLKDVPDLLASAE